ncbi:MAG TPA: hypothetical protein VLZ74_12795 [Methylocella sp.]|nr:hypothetical protein [Methylocella sp.]
MTIKRFIGACLLGAFLPGLAAGLSPLRAVSMDKSPRIEECAMMIGADAIQVSGYEPDVSEDKYCRDFPSTGKIIFAFDLGAPSMRDLPIEVRIIKDSPSTNADLVALTEAYLAPKIYKNGTISLEHKFEESGHFIVLVTLIETSGEKKTARFKFSVGQTLFNFVPLIVIGVVTGGALFYYWRTAVRQPKSCAAKLKLAPVKIKPWRRGQACITGNPSGCRPQGCFAQLRRDLARVCD